MSDSAKCNHYITQGEFAVSDNPQAVIATILGSCVSTCLWDPVEKVGGMNHFLLPEGSSGSGTDSFGANAMELLINGLIQKGAIRCNLKAKVFGGAALRKGLTSVGEQNSAFVIEYLEKEGIFCANQSLGGTNARRVEFEPVSGNARQKIVQNTDILEKSVPLPVTNDLELF